MGPLIIEPVWCVTRPKRSTSTSCRCPATFMPVEALWRWLREDVTYHYCHPTAEDLSRRVAAFETRLNQDACADRLWVKDHLDPDEEKLRQGNRIWSLRLLKAGSTSWGSGAINSDRGCRNAEEPASVRSFARRKGSSAVNHLPDFSYAIALKTTLLKVDCIDRGLVIFQRPVQIRQADLNWRYNRADR